MHSESQWRYRAGRRGLRLVKFKADSEGYEQYGPYALVDLASGDVVARNLDAAALERALFGKTPAG